MEYFASQTFLEFGFYFLGGSMKLTNKKYLLFLLSLVITILIVGFGNPAYQKEINKPPEAETKKNLNLSQESVAQEIETDHIQDKKPLTTTSDKQQPKSLIGNDFRSNTTRSTSDTNQQINQISITTNNSLPTPNLTPTTNQLADETPIQIVNLKIESLGNFLVNLQKGDSGWDILSRAAKENHFSLAYHQYSFGIWIIKLGDIENHDNYYWALYYNGAYSQVGISDLKPEPNDEITWKFETW